MSNAHEQDSSTAPCQQQKLYFAYGSNLGTTQMRNRCPASTPVGLAFLPAPWEWLINERGYANVVNRQSEDERPSGTGVYGVLYRLPPADEELLDGYEGVPFAYEKVMLPVVVFRPGRRGEEKDDQSEGYDAEALVYVDFRRVGKAEPLEEYVARMNLGIKEATETYGLPQWYVEKVMRQFIPAVVPTKELS
ncbi:hypothetical protein ACHAQH_001970 [Verticillium albo-atrum]